MALLVTSPAGGTFGIIHFLHVTNCTFLELCLLLSSALVSRTEAAAGGSSSVPERNSNVLLLSCPRHIVLCFLSSSAANKFRDIVELDPASSESFVACAPQNLAATTAVAQKRAPLFGWSESDDSPEPSKEGGARRAKSKENDMSLSGWMFNDSSQPSSSSSRNRSAPSHSSSTDGTRSKGKARSGAAAESGGKGGSSRRPGGGKAAAVEPLEPASVSEHTNAELEQLSRLLGKSRAQMLQGANAASGTMDDEDDSDDEGDYDDEGAGGWDQQRPSTSQASDGGKPDASAPKSGGAAINRIGDTLLHDWQLQKLERAFALGKRKVSVQSIAQETALDRSEVLAWFKMYQASGAVVNTILAIIHATVRSFPAD